MDIALEQNNYIVLGCLTTSTTHEGRAPSMKNIRIKESCY